jgi:LacI family transcriptional regulator
LITIKDIAKEANVSAGTVDRVLHNRGGVSPKTETKIRKILKQKKFKINLIASSLAMKKHHNLATMIPKHDEQNLFWKSPYSGIQKANQEVGAYGIENHIFLFDQFDPQSYLKAFRKLIKTKPDAVVMVPVFVKESSKIIEELNDKKIPYLFLNADLKGYENLCYIGQKSFEAGILSGKLSHLCSKEKDEFLIILTRKNIHDYEANNERIKGFINYFKENLPQAVIHQLKFDQSDGIQMVRKKINDFLTQNPRVRVVMVPSSRVSNICKLVDSDVLSGLKLIGFDTTPQNVEVLNKGIVSFLISQKSFNQGYKAITTMANYLVHKETPSDEIPMPLEIITKENYRYSHSEERNYYNEN